MSTKKKDNTIGEMILEKREKQSDIQARMETGKVEIMKGQQSFLALGQAKISLILALLRKVILLIPLIYILPLFFADKLMAVFLAEPVADVLAAITTFITFHLWCRRNLKPDNGIQ